CNVVFEALTAVAAYQKAVEWGHRYADEPPAAMRFLGISHLTTVGERLGDGVEICGRFFESPEVWDRLAEIVPPPESLKAVLWEHGGDKPLKDLLDPEQVAQLRRARGQDPK